MALIGLWMGSVPAYAETLEGTIISIDTKKNQMQIAPSGSGEAGENISVSVSEFIKANGLPQLNRLDVGKKVSMNVRKDSTGQWALTLLKKQAVLVPDVQEGGTFLKTKGAPKETFYPHGMPRKLKPEIK